MGGTVQAVYYDSLGRALRIELTGTFDYAVNREFLQLLKSQTNLKVIPVIVDCKAVVHIDSAALGMLLMLREMAGGSESDVTIVGCSPIIQKIFGAAHFDRLFKFS